MRGGVPEPDRAVPVGRRQDLAARAVGDRRHLTRTGGQDAAHRLGERLEQAVTRLRGRRDPPRGPGEQRRGDRVGGFQRRALPGEPRRHRRGALPAGVVPGRPDREPRPGHGGDEHQDQRAGQRAAPPPAPWRRPGRWPGGTRPRPRSAPGTGPDPPPRRARPPGPRRAGLPGRAARNSCRPAATARCPRRAGRRGSGWTGPPPASPAAVARPATACRARSPPCRRPGPPAGPAASAPSTASARPPRPPPARSSGGERQPAVLAHGRHLPEHVPRDRPLISVSPAYTASAPASMARATRPARS